MLTEIMNNTINYLTSFPKAVRKNYGQFFTSISTAQYMASMIVPNSNTIRILDAGCGNVMLSAAAIEHILSKNSTCIKEIELTLFETDSNIQNLMSTNLELISNFCSQKNVHLSTKIFPHNFITFHADTWAEKSFQGYYDIVICNPPYSKIGKNSDESLCMNDIVYGQPNIYALFMAMATHLLKETGQLIFIIPRSWTSGLYFRKFREYLLTHLSITRLHLFVSRSTVFSEENVLQETMIIAGEKSSQQNPYIEITTCNDANDYNNLRYMKVPSKICLPKSKNHYVLIPLDNRDIEVLSILSNLSSFPASLGYQFKTGQIVEFRNKDNLRYHQEEKTIPLIQPCNIVNGTIQFNITCDKPQFFLIDKAHEKMCIENCNTIVLKRFTSKEEHRRLQPAIHLKESLPDVQYITTENHVNYLVKHNGTLSVCEVYGFYVILSSELWERYYRILNGNTQVNSEELNTMPIPDIKQLQHIGRLAMHILKTENKINSDDILRRAFT